MITAFTVKNFKAIGEEPVRIELKPITLLFGANSAGKSSILHALNYAYSVFNEHNLNAEYNTHSGSIFDLGGFKRFIHREEKTENQEEKSKNYNILLRFDLDFKSETDIPPEFLSYSLEIPGPSGFEYVYNSIPMLDPLKMLNDVRTAYVEVEISWSNSQELPYISSYKTGLNSEWIATIYAGGYKKENVLSQFNVAHPIFNDLWIEYGIHMNWLIKKCTKSESHKSIEQYTMQDEKCKELPINRRREFEQLGRVPTFDFTPSYNLNLGLTDQKDALPNL